MSICRQETGTNQDRFLRVPWITPVDFRSEPRKRRLARKTSDYQVSSKPPCLRSGQQKDTPPIPLALRRAPPTDFGRPDQRLQMDALLEDAVSSDRRLQPTAARHRPGPRR